MSGIHSADLQEPLVEGAGQTDILDSSLGSPCGEAGGTVDRALRDYWGNLQKRRDEWGRGSGEEVAEEVAANPMHLLSFHPGPALGQVP